MGSNKNLQSVGKQDYGTPQALFDEWNKDFRFNLDACANEKNRKLENYLGLDNGLDAFDIAWDNGDEPFPSKGRVYCNCPYGRGITEKWIVRAREQVWLGNAEFILMLLPASTGTAWFDLCRQGKIKFLRGRIKFDGAPRDKNGRTMGAMHDSILVLFGKDPSGWKWDMEPKQK